MRGCGCLALIYRFDAEHELPLHPLRKRLYTSHLGFFLRRLEVSIRHRHWVVGHLAIVQSRSRSLTERDMTAIARICVTSLMSSSSLASQAMVFRSTAGRAPMVRRSLSLSARVAKGHTSQHVQCKAARGRMSETCR